MDIAEYGVNLFNHLTLQAHAEVEHAMGRGVLRSNVHHVVFLAEDIVLLFRERAVGGKSIGVCGVGERLVGHAQGVVLLRLVVLAEGIAHPVFAHIDAAHIGVAGEDDAVEVVDLALVDVCNVPKVAYRGHVGRFAAFANHLHAGALAGSG